MNYFLKKHKAIAVLVLVAFMMTMVMPAFAATSGSGDTDATAAQGNLTPAAIVYDADGNVVTPAPATLKDGQVRVEKTAVHTDEANDPNAYTVTLNVEGKGIVLPSQGADIVLVLDRSGSMSGSIGSMKTAAKTFVDTVLTKDSHNRVAVVSYASSGSTNKGLTAYTAATVRAEKNQALKTAIDGLRADGGTNTQAGIHIAQGILANSSATNKMIVLLSDGDPTNNYPVSLNGFTDFPKKQWHTSMGLPYQCDYAEATPSDYGTRVTFDYSSNSYSGDGSNSKYHEGWNGIKHVELNSADIAIYEANLAKTAGTTIYTIGYNTTNETNNVLTSIASSGKAYQAKTANIADIFGYIGKDISEQIKNSAVSDAIPAIVDFKKFNVIGTGDYNDGQITWTPDISGGKTATLSYNVKLNVENDSFNPGQVYDLNGLTTLTYQLGGKKSTVAFNVPSTVGVYGTVETIGYAVNKNGEPIDASGAVVDSIAAAQMVTADENYMINANGTKYWDPTSMVAVTTPETPTGYSAFPGGPRNADGTPAALDADGKVQAGITAQVYYYPFVVSEYQYTVEYYYQKADGTYPEAATASEIYGAKELGQIVTVSDADKTPRADIEEDLNSHFMLDADNLDNVWEGKINSKDIKTNEPTVALLSVDEDQPTVLKVYFKHAYAVMYHWQTAEGNVYDAPATQAAVEYKFAADTAGQAVLVDAPNIGPVTSNAWVSFDGNWYNSWEDAKVANAATAWGETDKISENADGNQVVHLYAMWNAKPVYNGMINLTKMVSGNAPKDADYTFKLTLNVNSIAEQAATVLALSEEEVAEAVIEEKTDEEVIEEVDEIEETEEDIDGIEETEEEVDEIEEVEEEIATLETLEMKEDFTSANGDLEDADEEISGYSEDGSKDESEDLEKPAPVPTKPLNKPEEIKPIPPIRVWVDGKEVVLTQGDAGIYECEIVLKAGKTAAIDIYSVSATVAYTIVEEVQKLVEADRPTSVDYKDGNGVVITDEDGNKVTEISNTLVFNENGNVMTLAEVVENDVLDDEEISEVEDPTKEIGYTVVNNYPTPEPYYPPYDPDPIIPVVPEDKPDPKPPVVPIDDEDVPQGEPEEDDDVIVVPGNEVIEDNPTPTSDAPAEDIDAVQSGDNAQTVAFALMLAAAGAGLVVTRRKFN